MDTQGPVSNAYLEFLERYDGRLPDDEATLLSFMGIGQYTAGAIRSFAFRQRAAILDTHAEVASSAAVQADGLHAARAVDQLLAQISHAFSPGRARASRRCLPGRRRVR